MKKRNKVVLVDEHDNAIGLMDKMEAHEKGLLHRAFSIFIFNAQGDMLIHQRAQHKYHGGGLWTNACCSHPQQGEDLLASAHERLNAEMGLSCALKKAFSFTYNTAVENKLIEHEYDHVFIGYSQDLPKPNPQEVQAFKWMPVEELLQEIKRVPKQYTYWFSMALPRVLAFMKV